MEPSLTNGDSDRPDRRGGQSFANLRFFVACETDNPDLAVGYCAAFHHTNEMVEFKNLW